MSQKRNYACRYSFEEWNKPVDSATEDVAFAVGDASVRRSKTDFGYADRVLIVSCIEQADGEYSMLLLDSGNLRVRDKKFLMEVAEEIAGHIAGHDMEPT